jgi:hypothetical protein
MARPKTKNPREHTVNVRFSTKELKELKRYAKKHNITTLSPFIRMATLSRIRQLDLFDEMEKQGSK